MQIIKCNYVRTETHLFFDSDVLADTENLRLRARDSEWLEDYCDGARYRRIQDALPEGTCALTSILFFDEIQRDAKGICKFTFLLYGFEVT
jgi:hypothetical protein